METLPGARVEHVSSGTGAVTNGEGIAKLSLPKQDEVSIRIEATSYEPKVVHIKLPQQIIPFEILLSQLEDEMDEVTISTERTN